MVVEISLQLMTGKNIHMEIIMEKFFLHSRKKNKKKKLLNKKLPNRELIIILYLLIE
jgi:hypothetical protein